MTIVDDVEETTPHVPYPRQGSNDVPYPRQGSNEPITLPAWAQRLSFLTSDIRSLKSEEGLLKAIYRFTGQAYLREVYIFSFSLGRATLDLIALGVPDADLLQEDVTWQFVGPVIFRC
ncbi:hypothetical protein AMTR_s00117p00123490 [Amborella trichopoda]|uniref:Uncharacterized protein n=1 Tax=Amborella trichopoda TaxID=13333 RepID=W1NP18_AMBTC|nr:hypothetical protein AMTR_s00117p00123490 [Amborella trichopoda]